MRMRLMVVAVVLFLLPGAFAQECANVPCDRACLENYVDRYMAAMDANDPSLELFNKDCRFTENGIQLPLGGEGLWYSMSGRGNYKFYVPDVETRQALSLSGRFGKEAALPPRKPRVRKPRKAHWRRLLFV